MPLTAPAIGDVFCNTFDEAVAEIGRRKRDADADGVVTSFEESPYGGYRVYSVPADDIVDNLVDPIYPGIHPRPRQRRAYR